jgi:hypothetical protein
VRETSKSVFWVMLSYTKLWNETVEFRFLYTALTVISFLAVSFIFHW